MQLLRLLSRVAFICNICFLAASFIQWLPNPPEGEPVATVIVMGYLLSALFNIIVNLWVLGLLLVKRLRAAAVPLWLLIVNFGFFMLQLTLLILNRK
jgi:hypothetical protein